MSGLAYFETVLIDEDHESLRAKEYCCRPLWELWAMLFSLSQARSPICHEKNNSHSSHKCMRQLYHTTPRQRIATYAGISTPGVRICMLAFSRLSSLSKVQKQYCFHRALVTGWAASQSFVELNLYFHLANHSVAFAYLGRHSNGIVG
jgi:hypothetical protein